MKTILVINAGSSSLKVSLFELGMHRILDAHLMGIGTKKLSLEITSSKSAQKTTPEKGDLKSLLDSISPEFGEVVAIGHRFVHGGDRFRSMTKIDPAVFSELEKLVDLAPLHNEACLNGIHQCSEYFKNKVDQYAVFDTAFFSDIPDYAAQYAIPQEIAAKHHIKRYGFHGISHAYLWQTYQERVMDVSSTSKIVTLHLGNGCSMAAILGGKALDTSMGFTPAEGLVMATRAGDIDAAILEYLCIHEDKGSSEVLHTLNFKSGLLGVSGTSSSMETLLEQYDTKPSSRLAVDMFVYRAVKYLGAYIAVLGGVDGILFSGGIGENAAIIRQRIIDGVQWLGVKIDSEINAQTKGLSPGTIQKIHIPNSKAGVFVVATDENKFIASAVRESL